MKVQFSIFIVLASLALNSCKSREDIRPYSAVETYPNDQNLEKISIKKAMVINAHDDDMCGMTGTISMLKSLGWEIRILTIPQSNERNFSHIKACKRLSDSVSFFNITYPEFRTDFETNKTPYKAIPLAEFEHIFRSEKIELELVNRVNSFQPSVIFTLDNEIGGYGHPEHIFMSNLVLGLTKSGRIKPKFIYQSVYSPSMMEKIMDRHSKRMVSWGLDGSEWEKAKETYKIKELPQPNVQINITSQSKIKMAWLYSYKERERKTMDFYVPAFSQYSADKYFEVFNREFYRVFSF